MKVLAIYSQDEDDYTSAEIYDVSTQEKKEKAFLKLFSMVREEMDLVCDLKEYTKDLSNAKKWLEYIDGLYTKAIADCKDIEKCSKAKRVQIEALEESYYRAKEVVRDIEERSIDNYDEDEAKRLISLYNKTNNGDGRAAERLLRSIAYYTSSKKCSIGPIVFEIVNVK